MKGEAAIEGDHISLIVAATKSLYDQMLVLAFTSLVGAKDILDIRALSNSIARLLMYPADDDMRDYLRRQGIKLPVDLTKGAHEGDNLSDKADSEATEDVVRQLLDGLQMSPEAPPPPATPPKPPAPIPLQPPPPAPKFMLPPLSSVSAQLVDTSGRTIEPRPAGGGGGGWGYPSFRTSTDVDRDQLVGARGEELIYQQELQRVRALGHEEPENFVIWTSRSDPGADHDIRSINRAGQIVWIEVKSTTGTDGKFEWSKKEFERAMRERKNYQLWRVYEAHTLSPTIKCFPDPIGLIAKQQLLLDISSLRVSIEGKLVG